jgi:farnesyl-diphosphate farnesyltransferase
MVGEGLTRLFSSSDDEVIKDMNFKQSISMGKFLQKTNILRDFHEDILEQRVFWPRNIASCYYKEDIAEFLVDKE